MRIVPSIRSLLLISLMLVIGAASFAQVGIGISVNFGPPALPVYEQPPCPAPNYIWTPGYWAYGPYGYYWVPGTWVMAPTVGFLWTPPWWGWSGGVYLFHEGYWGPHVGFYGGVAYGFGYFGNGYEGGRWNNGQFYYNRTVNNVNITNIHNTYNTTVINNTTVNRVSYNGGPGGIEARPSAQEQAYERENHTPPSAAQTQHIEAARSNPELRASSNQGKPPIAATAKPGDFREGAQPAREAGAPYHAPENRGGEAGGARPANGGEAGGARPENNVPRPPNATNPTHARELSPHQVPQPPNTGNAKQDQKYQQQQQKLYAKQNQQHEKLAQQQEKEDQRAQQQKANEQRQQQTEQRHQQQTQQMEQKHTQQQQKLQNKYEPPARGGEGGRPR